AYIGGTNDIILNNRTDHLVGYLETFGFLNAKVTVDVNTITEDSSVNVMVKPANLATLLPEGVTETNPESLDYYVLLGTINEAGVHEFTNTQSIAGSLVLVYHSDT